MTQRWHWVGILALWAVATVSSAADYRSSARNGAILYDAPLLTAKKRYVINLGYPVEVIVTHGAWRKVRDKNGALAWLPAADLSPKHTVVALRELTLWSQPNPEKSPNATRVAQVSKDVWLVLLAADKTSQPGWLHVAHASGKSGWVQLNEVWGAE